MNVSIDQYDICDLILSLDGLTIASRTTTKGLKIH
jgi:hypothetical protein